MSLKPPVNAKCGDIYEIKNRYADVKQHIPQNVDSSKCKNDPVQEIILIDEDKPLYQAKCTRHNGE